jgi:hypothetical protein
MNTQPETRTPSEIAAEVERTLAATPFIDIHTHLFTPPSVPSASGASTN